MKTDRRRVIRRTAEMLATAISMFPEPDDEQPYTWGVTNLGSAFCAMVPSYAEIEAVRLRANLHIGNPQIESGPVRSRRIVRIYPYCDDLLALWVNCN